MDFHITSNARIIGVGNGDPSSHEPDKATRRRAFNGLCMAVIQSNVQPGVIEITATSRLLKTATVTIEAKSASDLPSVPGE